MGNRARTQNETNENKMESNSMSSSSSSRVSSGGDLKHQLSQLFLTAMKTDRPRLYREFYCPEHIALTGRHYPRFRVTGASETGSSHVSYLARPYYSYKVPSKYGFSKFINVRKL